MQRKNYLFSIEFGTSSKIKMKTFILKAWYLLCTIFCLYSLKTLVEERYEVTIFAVDQSESDPIIRLICKDLSRFKFKRTKFLLGELRDELVNHFNTLKFPAWRNHLNSYKNLTLNRLKTGHYLIFNGRLCFVLKEESEEKNMKDILSLPVVYFAFKNSTLDFAQLAPLTSSFDQQIVLKKGYPYSNCSESSWRFRCLNECFKSGLRLDRYFYRGNETGLIYLKPAMNETIEKTEKSCFKKCWRENCKIVQLSPVDGEVENQKITTLEAKPKISKFDFYVQFIGLVCSFANISLNQLTSLVIKFVSSKVKKRKARIGLFCIKWAILFLSLVGCGYLYTTMFLGYKADERNPTRKVIMRNHIKEKTVRLVICINIEKYHVFNFSAATMSELERVTDNVLNNYLGGIHLNYQSRAFRVDYLLEPKVLFRYYYSLERCFSLLILPDYQLMPTNPKLTIKFKEKDQYLYLLTKNESFNQKSFEYKRKEAFMKEIVKRLEGGRCVNYRKLYVNCTSRLHCVESCTNRKALEKFKKIAIGKAVVDKDQFSLEEWNKIRLLKISPDNPNEPEEVLAQWLGFLL